MSDRYDIIPDDAIVLAAWDDGRSPRYVAIAAGATGASKVGYLVGVLRNMQQALRADFIESCLASGVPDALAEFERGYRTAIDRGDGLDRCDRASDIRVVKDDDE